MRFFTGTTIRQFLISFSAGLTAIGLVNLVRWLRDPVVGRRAGA